MASRGIFAGTSDEIALVLEPHCAKADWFIYPEGRKMENGKRRIPGVDVKKLLLQKKVFQDLKKLSSNVSFQMTKMREAMSLAFDRTREKWPTPLAECHKAEWSASMEERVRIACTHVGKALRSKTPPKWLQELLDGAEPGVKKRPSEAQPSESAPAPGAHEEEEEDEDDEEEE